MSFVVLLLVVYGLLAAWFWKAARFLFRSFLKISFWFFLLLVGSFFFRL